MWTPSVIICGFADFCLDLRVVHHHIGAEENDSHIITLKVNPEGIPTDTYVTVIDYDVHIALL